MIPTGPRLQLTHGALQFIAAQEGARVLHVKGPALHEELLQTVDGVRVPRGSTDADIIVEPRLARRVFRRLQDQGWRRVATFDTGSPFGHAATVWHDQLGYADVHRYFPGIGLKPQRAFDLLWADRTAITLGHQLCWVPSLDHQRLILLLHAARSSGAKRGDVRVAWEEISDDQRSVVREVARRFDAELPLAAAIGELDQWRGDRRHELWEQFSTAAVHGRSAEWRARIKAARSPLDAAKLAARSMLVNTDHMAMDLGRRPTRREVWDAWVGRFRRAIDENVHSEEER